MILIRKALAPVFVVGVGRSGTSLLQSMLASHSQLAFPPESQVIRRYIATRRLARAYAKEGMEGVVTVLDRDEHIRRLDLDIGSVLRRDPLLQDSFSDKRVYEALLLAHAAELGKSRIGDKDPRNIEYLPLIAKHWPDAYIVHIIRDPRDVLASKKRAAWSRKRHPLLHIFATRVQLALGRRDGAACFGARYYEILYENLITNPEKELAKLATQLDLAFEPEMLQFARVAKRLVSESEMEWKKETMGPLLRSNAGKWRDELQGWETALTELTCSEAFLSGGYERSNVSEQLRPAARVMLRLISVLFGVAASGYCAYRHWRSRA